MGLSANGTTKELFKLMEEGKLLTEDFLPYFSKELMEAAKNGGALDASMVSTAASIGRMQTAIWNANRTFNQTGFDKAVGSLMDQVSESVNRAEPLWETFGRISVGLGKALEVPIEFLGEFGRALGGAAMGADGTLNGEVVALAAAMIGLSNAGRTLAKRFLLPVVAMMTFSDFMANGVTSTDDLIVKLGVLTAAIVVYGNKLKWLAGIAAAHPIVLALLGLTYSQATGDGTVKAAAEKAGVTPEEYRKNNVFNPSQNMSPEESARLDAIRARREAKEAAQAEAERIDRETNQRNRMLQSKIAATARGEQVQGNVTHYGDINLNGTNKSPQELQEMILKINNGDISRAAAANPPIEKQ